MAKSEQDLLWVHNPTKAPFTVNWGGQPYVLQSNEKKIYPRFIAEHFAKHLADAILLRMEQKQKDDTGKSQPMLQHPVMRPKIVNMIILGVYSQFQASPEDPGAAIAHMVSQVNSQPTAGAPEVPAEDDKFYEDFGLVPDAATGNLAEPPDPDPSALTSPLPPVAPDNTNNGELLEQEPVDLPPAPTGSTPPTGKPKRTLAELRSEADTLGIKYKKDDSAEKIEQSIKNF